MKKIFSLLAAVLFVGSMMAEEATMAAGTNGSACTVNDVAGIKCGTSSKAGDMTITVGAGATKLTFYAAAWNGVSGLSLNLAADGVTFSPASVSLTADAGISNNSPFTLGGLPENFKFEVDLTGVTAETVISVTSSAAKRFVVWGASYEAGGVTPPAVATPVISGDVEFTDSVIVTITCSTPEADIYYTTDGTTDPKCDCAAAPEYTQQIVLKETTTIMAAAYTGNDWSAVATKTFTKKEPLQPITCAEVYDLAKGADVALSPVVVTYVNGKNVWVKDETASMLVYLSQNATWKAGDLLTGVAGTLDIYNGVHEVKPSADQVAAVVALPGEAPEAEEVIIVTTADVNKYIVMKGVEAEGTFAEGTASNLTINGVTVRNNFKNGYTFEAGKHYDVYGVVTIYQNNPQVYFITAEEEEEKGLVSVIEFTAKAAKGVLNDSIFFSDDMLLKLAITDTENKMEIDSNVAVFGDAAAQEIFSYRLKSGGKSSSKNNLKLTVPADGKLVIAARTGSNSETNRTVVVAQGTDTLYNKVVVEADTLDGKIYPFIMVDVKEGDVAVTYPVGSINFYAFAFVAEETPIVADTVVIDAITYGDVYTDYFLTDGAVDVVFTTQPIVGDEIVGDGYIVVLDILPEDANDITGVYSADSMTLDLSYSGVNHIVGTDTTSIEFVDGTVVFQVLQKSVEQNLAQLAIVGELEAEDGTVFIISAATVVYYEFIDEEGIEEIMAENEGKTIKFVQNGQVYILRDNKVYGLRGERIR